MAPERHRQAPDAVMSDSRSASTLWSSTSPPTVTRAGANVSLARQQQRRAAPFALGRCRGRWSGRRPRSERRECAASWPRECVGASEVDSCGGGVGVGRVSEGRAGVTQYDHCGGEGSYRVAVRVIRHRCACQGDVTQLPRSPVHSMPVRIPIAHGGCAGGSDRSWVGAWGLWFGTDGTLGGCRMTQRQGRRTCTISVVRAATR